jgi:hypothetical protein
MECGGEMEEEACSGDVEVDRGWSGGSVIDSVAGQVDGKDERQAKALREREGGKMLLYVC